MLFSRILVPGQYVVVVAFVQKAVEFLVVENVPPLALSQLSHFPRAARGDFLHLARGTHMPIVLSCSCLCLPSFAVSYGLTFDCFLL